MPESPVLKRMLLFSKLFLRPSDPEQRICKNLVIRNTYADKNGTKVIRYYSLIIGTAVFYINYLRTIYLSLLTVY